MLHGRIEHFFFRAGHFQRAVFFTRIIPAIDRFSVDTFASGSASSLKLSPSFVQNSLCDWAVSTLTPRTTAPDCSYFARSRWKFLASMVQPLVKSFG